MEWLQVSIWPLAFSVAAFVACAAIIGVAGTYLTGYADKMADRTGFGEAIVGAVLLGASTSISGSIVSVTAAVNDRPELSVGNALGGIAVQTAFLAIADFFHRGANLEHAAASSENMMQAALLTCLLSFIMIGVLSPEVTLWGVHPATPLLLGSYMFGIRLVHEARQDPMWRPKKTSQTRPDEPQEGSEKMSLATLIGGFAFLAALMGMAGWLLEHVAANIAQATGLTQSIMGTVFTATTTSLPELVTSIAAVRRGALTLAVSGIIGGNAFDTLFLAFSDIGYRGGSIYHAVPDSLAFFVALTLLMTGVLTMGLIRRQKKGLGGIGFESMTILVLYVAGIATLIP